MKSGILLCAALASALFTSCTMKENNPLLEESKLPYGAYSFDRIQDSDYRPAFDQALAEAKAEIRAIIENPEAPTFENTVEALEQSGDKMGKVEAILGNLNEACTDSVMQAVMEEIAPLATEFSNSIIMNDTLFQKVKTVWESRESLSLDKEQARLLENTYKSFVRNGANLSVEEKERYSKMAEELSVLSLRFSKNALAAVNAFTLNLTDSADLAGLPASVVDMAASEAKERGEEGWTFTLQYPSYHPFLVYSERRDLREKLWNAATTECVGGEYDNTGNILRIVELRSEMARILGFARYSDYQLENRMAKNTETVNAFLSNLVEKTFPYYKKELSSVQEYAEAHGFEGKLKSWDMAYWIEKLKNERYSFDAQLLKPYFSLENVQAAVFDLAGRLYGLKFELDEDIPVYHKDVRAFKVSDENGRFMGLLYMDYFPRESKRNGAWMTEFRGSRIVNGVEERPFVSVVTNVTKPTETTPSLLSFDDVTTIFHEFGHALHGLLAEGRYSSLTGTSVTRDFVELPSQLMENWAYEPEFLKTFAKHYQTGEVIPQEYIDKIIASKNYMAAYYQMNQLKYGILDMAWHSSESVPTDDPDSFERKTLQPLSLMPMTPGHLTSPTFSHIFAGGYSAGYYSYKWAEVIEADAFSLFKEKGIFSREVADSFRENVLSKGDLEDADVLYRNFRGRDPQPDALMKKLGLAE